MLQLYKVCDVNVDELTYPFRIVILMKRRFLVKINLFLGNLLTAILPEAVSNVAFT